MQGFWKTLMEKLSSKTGEVLQISLRWANLIIALLAIIEENIVVNE